MIRLHRPELATGPGRERRQLEDWCVANINYLMDGMGLHWGWWCALNLPRAELFGERMSGDVDLLAGPLGLMVSEASFDAMIRDERRLRPGAPDALHLNGALLRAGQEGLVEWPPDIRHTVAVEAKASYFVDGRWKATHERERRKILGSLRKRAALGINAIAHLHLGVVAPVENVDELHARADDALRLFPFFPNTQELEGFGYIVRIMGSIRPHDDATMQGLEDGPGWIQLPSIRPASEQSWHAGLGERLALLPRPEFFRTFIHRCESCHSWRHAQHIDPNWSFCACESEPEGHS